MGLMWKKVLLLNLIVLIVSPAWAVDYTQDANCVGAWLFTEGSGQTVADSSANSNTGNFKDTGEPAWNAMAGTNAPSYSDYMVTFDGNDYITLTDIAFTDKITVCVWVYSTAVNAFDHVISEWTSFGITGYTDNTIRFGVETTTAKSTEKPAILQDRWIHVVGVYDGVDITIYLNGSEQGTPVAQTGNVSGTGGLRIGRYSGGTANNWTGSMGEQALFDIDLDSTEINDIMDNGLAPAAPSARRTIKIM